MESKFKVGTAVIVNSNDYDEDLKDVKGRIIKASPDLEMFIVELDKPISGDRKWPFFKEELELDPS